MKRGIFQGILEWVMDSVKKGNKEFQERILLLQKEKDQVDGPTSVNTLQLIDPFTSSQ